MGRCRKPKALSLIGEKAEEVSGMILRKEMRAKFPPRKTLRACVRSPLTQHIGCRLG